MRLRLLCDLAELLLKLDALGVGVLSGRFCVASRGLLVRRAHTGCLVGEPDNGGGGLFDGIAGRYVRSDFPLPAGCSRVGGGGGVFLVVCGPDGVPRLVRMPTGASVPLARIAPPPAGTTREWIGVGNTYVAALDTTGKLQGHAVFDTLGSADASAALAAWLRSWPPGTIIGGAVRDEASLRLGQDAVDALKEIGVATDLRNHFRWSHAFVGVTGAAPGTALEDANLLRPAVVAVGPPVNGPRVFGQLQALEIDQTGYESK